MTYSALPTVNAGDDIDPTAWGNVVKSNQADHQTRISALEAATSQNSYSSPTRKIDGTTYQNTTGKKLTVAVSATVQDTGSAASGGITAYTDASSPPTTVVGYGSHTHTTANGLTTYTITFCVVPGNYYKVPSSASNCTVTQASWTEWTEGI